MLSERPPASGRTCVACSLNGLVSIRSTVDDAKHGTFSLDVLVALHETEFLDVPYAQRLPLVERHTDRQKSVSFWCNRRTGG